MWKRLARLAAVGIFGGTVACLALTSPASAASPVAFAAPAAAPLAIAAVVPGPTVTFSGGGLGLLLCGSKPDAARISVSAESRIRLTNALGMPAQLKIDGAPSGALGGGETVEVQFHRGPVAITMVPECALNLNPKFETLTVDVTSAPVMPPRPTTPAPRLTARPPVVSPANPGNPNGGLPALPTESLFPDELTNLPLGSAAPGSESSPATVVFPDGSSGKRLASENDPVDRGPIGLLAIIATVCVVGVSAGAIRAIITQRATRAEFA